jgi:hypothetical protein
MELNIIRRDRKLKYLYTYNININIIWHLQEIRIH